MGVLMVGVMMVVRVTQKVGLVMMVMVMIVVIQMTANTTAIITITVTVMMVIWVLVWGRYRRDGLMLDQFQGRLSR